MTHLVLAGIESALATANLQTERRKTSKAHPQLLPVERVFNMKFTAKTNITQLSKTKNTAKASTQTHRPLFRKGTCPSCGRDVEIEFEPEKGSHVLNPGKR
jgi:hypothetical protein